MPENPQTSRLHQTDEIGVCVGFVADEQVKNIIRELKYLWHNLDSVRPEAKVRATRDQFGQAWIYINGQGLKYIFLLAKNWKEFTLETPMFADPNKQATKMPPDFLR